MAHLHSVYDTDMHFSIDPITRVIRSEAPKKSIVQYSHNSERFTFNLPRYIEEHDMSLCNRVEIHFINIGTSGVQNNDVYEVDDWQSSPDDESVVIGSWLISRNATQLVGALVFLLRCACIADDGTIEYDWYTEINSDFSISKGMNNGKAVIAKYSDVLEAWKREIFAEFEVNFDAEKAAAIAEIEATRTGALSEIEAKGAATLATIPEDYTALSALAAENAGKADGIVCGESGEWVTLEDASSQPLRGLVVYGKSVQDGTPTPENPVPIVSVGEDGEIGVTIAGKNLMNTLITVGAAYTSFEDDGRITINNTTTEDQYPAFAWFVLPAGTYRAVASVVLNSGKQKGELYIQRGSSTDYGIQFMANGTKTLTLEEPTRCRLFFKVYAGASVTWKLNLTRGTSAVDYTVPAAHQNLTVSTPNGLPGIPVPSGGNYTDADGQQWICDEVDFGRGVYVQRMYKYAFDIKNSVAIQMTNTKHYMLENDVGAYVGIGGINGICTVLGKDKYGYDAEDREHWYADRSIHFYIANNNVSAFEANGYVDVLYPLKTPIETPLSETELAAYRALHTSKPNTTVYADENAGLSVAYAADTKTYIDNKFAELATAVLQNA